MIVNHDSRAKDLHPLKKPQDVTVRSTEDATKMKGTVTKQCDDRSYSVKVGSSALRRKRIHIRETPSYHYKEDEDTCYPQGRGDQLGMPQCRGFPQPGATILIADTKVQGTTPMPDTHKPRGQPRQPSTSFITVRPRGATALLKRLNDSIAD